MPVPLTGKSIEMPYGSALAANNLTFHDRSGRSLFQEENNLIPGEVYTHNSLFPVMNSVPRISLTVVYIIREKLGPQRKKSNWKTFPGKTFVCIEIPVQLTSKPSSSSLPVSSFVPGQHQPFVSGQSQSLRQ